jgi:hypothetical protein
MRSNAALQSVLYISFPSSCPCSSSNYWQALSTTKIQSLNSLATSKLLPCLCPPHFIALLVHPPDNPHLVRSLSHLDEHQAVEAAKRHPIGAIAIDRAPELLKIDRGRLALAELGEEPQRILVEDSTEHRLPLLYSQVREETLSVPATAIHASVCAFDDLLDSSEQPQQRVRHVSSEACLDEAFPLEVDLVVRRDVARDEAADVAGCEVVVAGGVQIDLRPKERQFMLLFFCISFRGSEERACYGHSCRLTLGRL